MKMSKSLWIVPGALLLASAMSLPAAAQDNAPPPPMPPQQISGAQPLPPLAPLRRTDSMRETDSYRLVYTLTESENGRRMGVQHEELVVATEGPPSELKLGSRIPINVGGNENAALSTQIEYFDIGLNISARMLTFANGVQLNTQVEQSSIDDTQKQEPSQRPIIRQTNLRTSMRVVENKPIVIGSLDLPGSDHHLQVEVTMTRVQ
ncbi:MAG TPA: hypothetical protein VHX63_09900 [Acidobacteriaceae bacterium]|jgi:hypothetical protein|nr:hypothetical protein [Acidobacteriaceae bacterium]